MPVKVTAPPLPQAPHNFHHTPEDILAIADRVIARNRALEDRIGALKPEECTFDSVVRPLALDEGAFDTESDPACFLSSVSTDKAVRDAATEATKRISDYGIESSMREDIYLRLKDAQQNTPANSLDPESARLLEKMLQDKRRAGLGLPEKEQAEYKRFKTEISNKCIDFSKNCDEEDGFLLFTKEELNGVPDSVIAGFPKQDADGTSKHKVTHKTPDIIPIIRYAKNPETRKRAYLSYENKNTVNTPLFSDIMKLRTKAAKVLGYDTWADYIIEPKMAKTAATASDFLNDLLEKLKPIGAEERDRLLELKETECKELGIKYEPVLYAWDYRYLDRLYIERNLDLDDEKVKEYLPAEHVVNEMLEIYSHILGVTCIKMEDQKVWHEEVTVFSVWDTKLLESGADAKESYLGQLYLDLYPREAKYGHAAVWGLIPSYKLADGTRQYSTSAMVANLAKPTAEQPALLSHDDFVTLFHEMGHAYHGLTSNRPQYARFHGTRTARDFVECPSQSNENWCFIPEVMRKVSKHYKTGETIPDELINKIIKGDATNKGLFNLRQLYFGLFDLEVHTSKQDIDYTKLWNEKREEVALTSIGDAELPAGQGSFAHLVGGYDAGYYGYMYSLSFAADVFATVFEKDPLSPEAGARYRKSILSVGGSRDEMESLTELLGRAPNNEAFMRKLLRGARQ